MLKKILLGILSINLFANNILMFEEFNVNGRKFLVQQTISQNLEEVVILKNFEYTTKSLIKIVNNYVKNQKLFNSIEDNSVLKNINYLLVDIIKTNGDLWEKPILYQGKEYEVLYNLLYKILSDRKLLLTSNENVLLNSLIKKDLINKAISLQETIIKKKNKHKFNKKDIQKVREFYIVLYQVMQDYKDLINQIENLNEVKLEISKNPKLKVLFDKIDKKIITIQQNIQNNLIKLNQWNYIKIF